MEKCADCASLEARAVKMSNRILGQGVSDASSVRIRRAGYEMLLRSATTHMDDTGHVADLTPAMISLTKIRL